MGRVRIQPHNTVFIGNLPFDLSEMDIINIFPNKSQITRSFFPRSRNRLQGIGFITFKTEEDCEKAIEQVHRTQVKNRQVVVRWADHRKDKDDPNQNVEVEYVSDDEYDKPSRGRKDRRDRDKRRDRPRNYERRNLKGRRRDSDYSSDDEENRRRPRNSNPPPPNQYPPGYNPMLLPYYWMQQMPGTYGNLPVMPPNAPPVPPPFPYMPNQPMPLNMPLPNQPIVTPPNIQAIPPPPTNLLGQQQSTLPPSSPQQDPLSSSLDIKPLPSTTQPSTAPSGLTSNNQDSNKFSFESSPPNQLLLAMVNKEKNNNSNQS